jgi:hypothetical protein
LGGRDDSFGHDFVNHIRLAGVVQLFARKVERLPNIPKCGVIEHAHGNEPKNSQRSHATPLRAHPTSQDGILTAK